MSHRLNVVDICHRGDTFSLIVAYLQLAPIAVPFALSGIGLFKRDLTLVFVVWITWSFAWGVSHALAYIIQDGRPDEYECSRKYAMPDPIYVATVATITSFIFICITSRLNVYLSTIIWLSVGLFAYSFAVWWNKELFLYQIFYSFGHALIFSALLGAFYTLFLHPVKYVMIGTVFETFLGFENAL
jgi:hypothetical protein